LLVGLNEDTVSLRVVATGGGNGTIAVIVSVALGLDSTTTPASDIHGSYNQGSTATDVRQTILASYEDAIGIGRHSLVWLERTEGGTSNWIGTNSTTQSGMKGFLRC